MKRKLFIILLSIATFCCALGLVACDTETTPDNPNSKQYTVTYDANGGFFEDGSSAFTQMIDSGSKLTAPVSPTKAGSDFIGWATAKDGETLWQFAIDVVTKDITLYATWEEQSASVISIDGASIDEQEKSIYMLVDKDTDSVSLSDKVVCSSGCVWGLYFDEAGQSVIPTKIAVLSDGDNISYIIVNTNDGNDINVYELKIHKSYPVTVNYYDNGNELIQTDSIYSGYEYKISFSPNIDGYTFNYWLDDDGQKIEKITPYLSVNLYAVCTVNTYTATLNVNGGNELQKLEYIQTYGEPFSFEVPSRTGYTFGGWYYGNTQITNAKGVSLEDWSYTSDKTFTAKWSANAYTVTLNKDAENSGAVDGDGEYNYDSVATITSTTSDGYTWLGWYGENGELVTNEARYSFVMGLDVSYTAKWMACPVTLEKSNEEAGIVSGVYGATYLDKETTVIAETNSGYTWIGWYDGDTQLTKDLSYTFTMSAERVTYTAKWIKVTLEANNTEAGLVPELTGKYKVGEEVTFVAETNSGYVWLGWYNGEIEITKELIYTAAMPSENVTYTAKWIAVPIVLNQNSNVAGTITALDGKYVLNEELTITAETKDGYNFIGWFSGDELLTGENSYKIIMTDENKTYTAKWDVNITYLGSDGNVNLYDDANIEILSEINDRKLSGWYLFKGTVSSDCTLTVENEAHIILADGCDWSVNNIIVEYAKAINIYSQSSGESAGKLTINHNFGGADGKDGVEGKTGESGYSTGQQELKAGKIGGNGTPGSRGGDCGAIIINGGIISANNIGGGNGGRGGAGGKGGFGGSGIKNSTSGGRGGAGGNGSTGGAGGNCGTIIINGGAVSATKIGGGNGGDGGDGGAGRNGASAYIDKYNSYAGWGGSGGNGGDGGWGGSGGNGGRIIINGGTVSAARIGGGISGNGGAMGKKGKGGGGTAGGGKDGTDGRAGGRRDNGINAVIYFNGPQSDWVINESSTENADLYYYSENEPPFNVDETGYDGNYWHYVNGEIVVWTKTI